MSDATRRRLAGERSSWRTFLGSVRALLVLLLIMMVTLLLTAVALYRLGALDAAASRR